MPSAARRGVTSPPVPSGTSGILQEAVRLLRRGSYAAVQAQIEQLRKSRLDPAAAEAVRQLLAEAHFRAAMLDSDLTERLRYLTAALVETPDAPKLHFHRGVTLWQLARVAEVLPELDAAAAREPQRRGLAYLRALARIAAGQPWDAAGLTPVEANTARLVQKLTQRKPRGGTVTFDEPLLGKGTELWQALIAMREDPAAAPHALLKVAVEQNMRKPIARVLNYYKGVAALRAGDREGARAAWLYAQGAGYDTPELAENLTALLRAEAVELSQAGRWQDLINLLGRVPDLAGDRVLAETGGLAYYHLGYEAAQAGKWQLAAQHWRKSNELDANRYVSQNLALAEEALQNWDNAAEAWREMVRRRPRKEDHPDYLTDIQVAALWSHVADCYQYTDFLSEVETCLRNALKYAPDDTALRLRLADALLDDERPDAAETQLDEIIAVEPQHIEALERLGRLYENRWDRDAMAIWRRVLAINPTHPEARDALADGYIEMVSTGSPFGFYNFTVRNPGKSNIEVLEEGLRELPDHPKLLVELGMIQARANQHPQARASLLRAFQVAPQDVRVANSVVHELLHANAGDAVEAIIPQVGQIPGLLPAFWLDQASKALQCKFGEEWADAFIEEALKLADAPWVDDTRAGLLVAAFEVAQRGQAADLVALLEKRIRAEVPDSGAVQYLEAYRLHSEKQDIRGATRLIREAIRKARQANDKGVLRRAEAIEPALKGAPLPFDIRRIMRDLFPEDL